MRPDLSNDFMSISLPLIPITQNRYVESAPWDVFPLLIIYSGPGKLKIFKSASYVHDENSSETCIERMQFSMFKNQDVVEAVGTFINGTLHGTAKLVLANNYTVITNFKNGTMDGKNYWDYIWKHF